MTAAASPGNAASPSRQEAHKRRTRQGAAAPSQPRASPLWSPHGLVDAVRRNTRTSRKAGEAHLPAPLAAEVSAPDSDESGDMPWSPGLVIRQQQAAPRNPTKAEAVAALRHFCCSYTPMYEQLPSGEMRLRPYQHWPADSDGAARAHKALRRALAEVVMGGAGPAARSRHGRFELLLDILPDPYITSPADRVQFAAEFD